jgi:hypothetical protein
VYTKHLVGVCDVKKEQCGLSLCSFGTIVLKNLRKVLCFKNEVKIVLNLIKSTKRKFEPFFFYITNTNQVLCIHNTKTANQHSKAEQL